MKPIRVVAIVVGSVALSYGVLAQGPTRDGRWEITMEMEMAGMPMKMPPIKTTQCITKEQAKDPNLSLPSGSPDSKNDCKVSDYKVDGSKVSWKVKCQTPTPVSGSGEITYTGSTFDGLMKMTMEQGEMTMKYKGKRLGDCAE